MRRKDGAPTFVEGSRIQKYFGCATRPVGELLQAAVLPKWILDAAIYGEALNYCKTGLY
jgi:hypothetical protein